MQVGDWPQDKAKDGTVPFPFFSWCGAEDYRDIVWPQYDILRSTIQAMDRLGPLVNITWPFNCYYQARIYRRVPLL